MTQHLVNENLENGDLNRLISKEIRIDEYKSKMGDDADICVVSFSVANKEPASDLMSFIEKGYDWVLDADVSSGEKTSGEYLVFIEIDRSEDMPEHINSIIGDITNLVEFKRDDWTMQYHKSDRKFPVTADTVRALVPLTPEAYNDRFKNDIDTIKMQAGVDVTTKAPTNEYTNQLRVAAGIL